MDRSFLSDASIIKASRHFVCIRTATYENSEEAEFLKKIYRGRSPDLENTVFALMDPDAAKLLSRSGRSPDFAYRSPSDMVDAMSMISMAYPGNEKPVSVLPQMDGFRLALNVAACDGLPLVVAFDKKSSSKEAFSKQLAPLAFDEELAGKYHYVIENDAAEFKKIKGFNSTSGVYLIEPDDFGVEGRVVQKFDSDAKTEDLKKRLVELAGKSRKARKDYRNHIKTGIDKGLMWETAIPVTDPGSLKQMERVRGGK